jgi:microfibrillar-associated protein 1
MSKAAPRPARPAGRYWRGKAAVADAASDSEDSEAEQVDARGLKPTLTAADLAKREGLVIQTDLDLSIKIEPHAPATTAATPREATAKQESAELETDSEDASSSEASESESEPEAPTQPLFKPVFVSK